MVMHSMSWLSGARTKATNMNTRKLFCLDKSSSSSSTSSSFSSSSSSDTLGILSFEAAKTMTRLVYLYMSLSNDEFSDLRKGAMKSRGVAFLNSNDERFLLNLACGEKLEELDRAVDTATRLGRKCRDVGLNRFDQTYAEMCLGIRDFHKLDYGSKSVEKLVEKMEKYVKATSNLHSAMECLAELEISERKIKKWKKNLKGTKANTDYFDEKIRYQRKQVKHFRDVSLWKQTFDQIVGLMTRIITIIYARICVLFGPYVSDLPRPSKVPRPTTQRIRVHPVMHFTSRSGPLVKSSRKITKLGPLPKSEDKWAGNRIPLNIGKNKKVKQSPAESTVGGAGLAQRYANIIIYAERYLHAPTCIDDETRGCLYGLLPESLKMTVRGKLWGHWCTGVHGGQQSIAEGWREVLEDMMTWLAPVAHDTVKWQQERYFEKQRFDAKPTVMLFQTLYFADLEKTEGAIVEVLVGLSCIYRFENKRLGGRSTRGWV